MEVGGGAGHRLRGTALANGDLRRAGRTLVHGDLCVVWARLCRLQRAGVGPVTGRARPVEHMGCADLQRGHLLYRELHGTEPCWSGSTHVGQCRVRHWARTLWRLPLDPRQPHQSGVVPRWGTILTARWPSTAPGRGSHSCLESGAVLGVGGPIRQQNLWGGKELWFRVCRDEPRGEKLADA
jgi:hypothetical protein